MGCASSKSAAVKAEAYCPAPSSFAVFDINSIKEPWIVVDNPAKEDQDQDQSPSTTPAKPAKLPATILDQLNKLETADDAPKSTWVEVSMALQDLKPTAPQAKAKPESPPTAAPDDSQKSAAPRKNLSFHTLEELDAKLTPKPPAKDLKKTESLRPETKAEQKPEPKSFSGTGGNARSLSNNPFIQRDREEREKEGKMAAFDLLMKSKRDPFSAYPEKCPPAGENAVVVYTTTLHGIRRTYEECNRARSILESHRVVFDERDVSLHGEFRTELKELLGEGAAVPQVFVKGRHLGGVDELVDLNETGRFGRMLELARIEKGPGRQGCEGCGGARFMPCLDCGGSCKVVVGDTKERCGSCNENGLVHCPACY